MLATGKTFLMTVTFILSSTTSPYTTQGAAKMPQMMAAHGSTTEHPAVMATSPVWMIKIMKENQGGQTCHRISVCEGLIE